MNIVILDGYTANPGDLSWDRLQSLAQVTIYDRTAPDEVVTRAKEADGVLTNKVIIDEAVMAQLPRLRYIGVMATGYNVVDLDAARRRGIAVTNVPAYSTASVAQMVFAHLLGVCNSVALHNELVHKGQWVTAPDFTFTAAPLVELAGKRMGLVGLGQIGVAVARVALAMGMEVLALTSKSQEVLDTDSSLPRGILKVTMNELFETSDIISLHCPLTSETKHLINKERLQMMKPTAILINTGRGPLIDEAALAHALKGGEIAAACVDVLSVEQPTPDNPLLTAPNCYITPHIAWATREARSRLIHTIELNVEAFIRGERLNRVE